MTKKNRAILFSICVFLFILTSLVIILYSLGYRLDFETKKIQQTGALYFRVLPRSADIYLNDRLKKRTDFFFGSALIGSLLPKQHNIQIKKEGFFTWEKNLEVSEKKVTEAKNITLIKQSPVFSAFGQEIENFFISPNGRQMITLEKREIGWELKLYDSRTGVKSHLIKSTEITRKEAKLLDLSFAPNGQKVLLKIGAEEVIKYFLLDLETTPPKLSSLDFLGNNIIKASFHPQNPQKLFFQGDKSLKEVDLTGKTIFPTTLNDVLTWTILNEDIYYVENTGHLFKTSTSFSSKEKITENPFPVKAETDYNLMVFPGFIFISENKAFYLLNQEEKEFEIFFENVNKLALSPDQGKLVFFTDFEVWLLFLRRFYDQPQRVAGEKIFLTRFSEKIGNIFWLNSHYLIFSSGDKIKVSEIDNRDRINIFDLADFKATEIFFNSSDKKLYLLSEKILFVSEAIF